MRPMGKMQCLSERESKENLAPHVRATRRQLGEQRLQASP
jgi:hypothetical protein